MDKRRGSGFAVFVVLSRQLRFNGPAPACMNEVGKQLTQSNGARRGRRGIAAASPESLSVLFLPHPRHPRLGGSPQTAVLCGLCALIASA